MTLDLEWGRRYIGKVHAKMEHITKRFHGVTALDDVSFEVEKGKYTL